MLDAIAPGDVATWDRLLDPAVIQVDENDVIRHKAEILAALKPLGPGLVGHLKIDDFQVSQLDDVAVVTHEDEEYLDYTADGWRLLGSQVLAVLKDPPPIVLPMKTLCGYSGHYSMTPEISVSIQCSKDRLLVERPVHPERTFLPEVKDVFFEPGQPRTRRIFVRDSTGAITGFVDRREARDVAWRRIG